MARCFRKCEVHNPESVKESLLTDMFLFEQTASIAGALFGYDTGIISAVLVYLGNDLDGRPTSSGEKELITSLCSGGAFVSVKGITQKMSETIR